MPLLNTGLGGKWNGARVKRVYQGLTRVAGRTNMVRNPSMEYLTGLGIAATVRRNLMGNGSFELNNAGWSGWAGTGHGRDATVFYGGTASLKITTASTAAQGVYCAPTYTPVTGDVLRASVMVNLAAGYGLQFGFRATSGGVVGSTLTTSTGTWQLITATYTIPASPQANYSPCILTNTPTPPTATVFWIDNVICEVNGPLNNPYFDGSTPSVPPTVYTWEGTAYASISRSTVTQAMRVNQVTNPGMEVDITGWNLITSVITRDTTEKHGGTASLKTVTSSTSQSGMATNGTWPCIPGEWYTASCWVKADLGVPMRFVFRTGPSATYDTVQTFTGTGDWQRVTVSKPSHSTAGTTMGVQVRTNTSIITTFWVDEFLIELGPQLLDYFSGASTNTANVTHTWQGTAHNSMSNQVTNGVIMRTNLATDPGLTRLGVPPGGAGAIDTGAASWGTGGAGTYSIPVGGSDNFYPCPGLQCMVRKTWSTASTDSLDGGQYLTNTGLNGLAVTAGTSYAFSVYQRQSAGTKTGYVMRARWYNAAGGLISTSNGAAVEISATWGMSMRPSLVATAPALAVAVDLYVGSTTATYAVGTQLDTYGLLIEASTAVGTWFHGSIRPPLRVNRLYNPTFTTTTGGLGSYYSPVVSLVPDGHRGNAIQALMSAADFGVPRPSGLTGSSTMAGIPGDLLHMRMWLKRTPNGPAAINVSFNYDAGTGGAANALVPLTEEWTEYEVSYVVVAGAPLRNYRPQFIMPSSACPVGEGILVDDLLWEVNGTADGRYIDGDTSPNDPVLPTMYSMGNGIGESYEYDPDLTPAWTGVVNASQSILIGVPVYDYPIQLPRRSYSSTRWTSHGPRSIRVATHSTTSNDSFQAITSPGFQAGKSYLITATLRLNAVQLSPSPQARTFLISTQGGASAHVILTAVPNQVGTWPLVERIDVPAGVTSVSFYRLMNGGQMQPNVDDGVWWDDLMIQEVIPGLPLLTSYRDGSSPQWAWDGTPNLSTSNGWN